MKEELKTLLDASCMVFDLVDSKAEIMKQAGSDQKLCNVLKYELMTFLMCVSASDGRISRVEAQLIREYFNIEVYPIHIKQIIDENGIGDAVYYKKVPECLRLAVVVDNYLYRQNPELKSGLSDCVLELFKAFGKEMIVADEKVKIEERLSWETYISMMMQYAVDNCDSPKESKGEVLRPGVPIRVNYDVSLDKINRIYSLYVGRL